MVLPSLSMADDENRRQKLEQHNIEPPQCEVGEAETGDSEGAPANEQDRSSARRKAEDVRQVTHGIDSL
jgi:hypothetical protein